MTREEILDLWERRVRKLKLLINDKQLVQPVQDSEHRCFTMAELNFILDNIMKVCRKELKDAKRN